MGDLQPHSGDLIRFYLLKISDTNMYVCPYLYLLKIEVELLQQREGIF